MAEIRGRCLNTEFCSLATEGTPITLPDTVPFECPRCGEPLASQAAVRASGKGRLALLLQGTVIVIGAGAIGYKLLSGPDAGKADPVPPAVFPRETAAVPPTGSRAGGTTFSTPPAIAAPAPIPAPAASTPAPAPAPAAATPTPDAPLVPPSPPADPARVTETTILRLAGSDVIGARLIRRLATGYLALVGDANINTSTGGDGVTTVAGAQSGERELITITPGNTAAGLTALLRGRADFAMAGRKITAVELERTASLGDLTNAASENVIAVQGIAVVTSPSNRLNAITMVQLRGILSGRIRDWAEVGGAPGPIRVVALDSRNGMVDTPSDLFEGTGADLVSTKLPSDEAIVAATLADAGSIGLVPLSVATNARILAVADAGAPVLPTEQTISTEEYPLARRLYLYSVGNNKSPAIRPFVDYIASASGQAAVKAAGFTPLTIRTEPAALPDTTSDRFRQLIGAATRVSITFRFQQGGTDLDNRGLRDMERLSAYLRAQRVPASKLIVAGFADNSGTPAANAQVAQRRTEVVTAALGRYGITPGKASAFGAEMPVGDNSTADGRERNRRVEVYLAP